MRAARLGLADAPVRMAAETNIRDILTTLEAERPDLVIIDSIQTMWADHVDSVPGSVSQVRACAQELTVFAKRSEEHTSELQSRGHLVCRLLLEKKKM